MQQNTGSNTGGTEYHIYLFRNQDFYTIRDWCVKRDYLFEDPNFELDYNYEWLRPFQLVDDPQMYVEGTARFDILQGELGDCWMLASIAALGMYPELVRRVIPSDNSFSSLYAGIFHFRFWQFGRWFDVVIDDRLPTMNGKLVYTKSVSQNEFWTALLEKAYCKILGGNYKVADAGNLCEALEDFTGGIVEQFCLQSAPRNLDSIVLKSMRRCTLIGCFIDDSPGQFESKTDTGLVKGHSYTVTGAKKVNLPGYGSIVLIRVRNPWGKHEWKGAWSDGSPEWTSVPASTKQQLGLVYQDDGEFWMSFDDWKTHFMWSDMCHLCPEAFADSFGKQEDISSWYLKRVRGSWVRGLTAGGVKYLNLNPQIRFTLSVADDENQDGLCSVLIALLQKKSGCQGDQLEIGFNVYRVSSRHQSALDYSFFQTNKPIADVPSKMVREVSGRFDLPPGSYCIIPFTYEVGKESEFMVRIYSEKASEMDDTDYRIGSSPIDIEKEIENPELPSIQIRVKNIKKSEVPVAINDRIRKIFDPVSGVDEEVDWKELQTVLAHVRLDAISGGLDDSGSLGHFLTDSVKYAWNKFFGSKPKPKNNAFLTVGPHGFSKELCRTMVSLLDVDHSGKLGINEFQDLWNRMRKWQSIYEQHSDKTDGYLSSSKLKDALDTAGFHFNSQTITDIVRRYSCKDGKIAFDDFLCCSIKIRTMQDLWMKQLTITKAEDKETNKPEFTLEQFMDYAMYS